MSAIKQKDPRKPHLPRVRIHRAIPLLKGMHNPSPIIDELLAHGIAELKIKYPAYGNSYTNPDQCSLSFWKKRLDNEIAEYKKCLTPMERKRKLANLFNLVWMAYGYELVEGKVQ